MKLPKEHIHIILLRQPSHEHVIHHGTEVWVEVLHWSWCLLLDDDYESGVGSDMAYKLMKITKKNVEVLGLKNKSAGFSKQSDNLPPNKNDIVKKIFKIIKKW